MLALLPLGATLAATEVYVSGMIPHLRADLIIAMAVLFMTGFELGGLSSTMKSDFDPFMARLGIKSIGNVAFAGTQRTDILNGRRALTLVTEKCTKCGHCYTVCPLGVWESTDDGRALLSHPESCTACGACIRQCPSGAVRAARRG